MHAISTDMPRAALIRQDPGRPHVPTPFKTEGLHSTMSHAFVPQQRQPEAGCPVSGCVSDHLGELPGQRSHWYAGEDVATSSGLLLVDVNTLDGQAPEVVLHDPHGNARRLSAVEAAAYSRAILSAATTILNQVGAVS